MKKAVLMFALSGATFVGFAQEKFVTSANVALKEKNFDEAKDNIDKAMASPETKDKPKTLFAKGQIYMSLQAVDKYKASNPYREGANAFLRIIEVKPDYEKQTVDAGLIFCSYRYYNDAITSYRAKKMDEAYNLFGEVVKIHDLGGGKRLDKAMIPKDFDTVAANARMYMANTVYYQGKYAEAVPLLIAVKNNPISKQPAVYESLFDAYSKQNKSAEALATIQEARAAYPNDNIIRNLELNYYITSGKQDEMLKKLEEAAAKEPENAEIQMNLATTYLEAMRSKDKKPANMTEFSAKTEAAFQRGMKLAPDNAGYNYSFGTFYYFQTADVIEKLNALGTSAAEQKKYDELKATLDGLFTKSLPYFEKAYTGLSAEAASLKGDDMKIYKSTISVLQDIYARQGKTDKATEMRKKLESLK